MKIDMKWNSRKVIFGLLLLAVGVAIELLSPRGLTETMAMFLGAIGAAYFAGNVAEHAVAGKKGQVEAAFQPLVTEAIEELGGALGELRNEVARQGQELSKQNGATQETLTTIMNANSYIIQRAFGGGDQATGS